MRPGLIPPATVKIKYGYVSELLLSHVVVALPSVHASHKFVNEFAMRGIFWRHALPIALTDTFSRIGVPSTANAATSAREMRRGDTAAGAYQPSDCPNDVTGREMRTVNVGSGKVYTPFCDAEFINFAAQNGSTPRP
jgi:hypothetical protein